MFREISIKDPRLKKYYDCEVRSISPFESHMGYDVMDIYLNDKEEKKNNINQQVKRKKYKIIGRKPKKGQQE